MFMFFTKNAFEGFLDGKCSSKPKGSIDPNPSLLKEAAFLSFSKPFSRMSSRNESPKPCCEKSSKSPQATKFADPSLLLHELFNNDFLLFDRERPTWGGNIPESSKFVTVEKLVSVVIELFELMSVRGLLELTTASFFR